MKRGPLPNVALGADHTWLLRSAVDGSLGAAADCLHPPVTLRRLAEAGTLLWVAERKVRELGVNAGDRIARLEELFGQARACTMALYDPQAKPANSSPGAAVIQRWSASGDELIRDGTVRLPLGDRLTRHVFVRCHPIAIGESAGSFLHPDEVAAHRRYEAFVSVPILKPDATGGVRSAGVLNLYFERAHPDTSAALNGAWGLASAPVKSGK